MVKLVPFSGNLQERDFPTVLYTIYKKYVSGILTVRTGEEKRIIHIEDKEIIFASTTSREYSFAKYLIRQKIVSQEEYEKAREYQQQYQRKLGRSLLELGTFDYETLWTQVQNHIRSIVYSLFPRQEGIFELALGPEKIYENIVVKEPLLDIILQGIRHHKMAHPLFNRVDQYSQLYCCSNQNLAEFPFKKHELHIYNLMKRTPSVAKIIAESELFKLDTLKILNAFALFGLATTTEQKDAVPAARDSSTGQPGFASFEEALKFYNQKFIEVYKAVSKEIGPIGLSILSKALKDINDKLPHFLQGIELQADGGIQVDKILKAVWYFDFDKNVTKLTQGLEEILHAELHTVKKNLGHLNEREILKAWKTSSEI